jgi:putative transcriptional regulator
MASTRHPDLQFLNDYAAGSLSAAQSLCVAVHLAYCAQCRAQLKQLTSIGGVLIEQLAPTPVSNTLLDRVMAQIDAPQTSDVVPSTLSAQPSIHIPDAAQLPKVVGKLALSGNKKLRWRRISTVMSMVALKTGDLSHETILYKIRAGGKLMLHGHRGTEITVVLRGSFSDFAGVYHNGDFIVRDSDDVHAPTATLDDDCMCLSVVDQPARLLGFMRILNPFMRINPQ